MFGHGHCDADGGGLADGLFVGGEGLEPWVVGDGEDEGERVLLCVEVLGDDAAVEDLGERVGGDESEAADLSGTTEFGGASPPEHDEIG